MEVTISVGIGSVNLKSNGESINIKAEELQELTSTIRPLLNGINPSEMYMVQCKNGMYWDFEDRHARENLIHECITEDESVANKIAIEHGGTVKTVKLPFINTYKVIDGSKMRGELAVKE